MTATEPITSAAPSSSVSFRGYFSNSEKNWAHVVGRSRILSVRYTKPVVPQSFGTDHLSSGSYGRPRNFGSIASRTLGRRFQSIRCRSPSSASVATM